MGAAPQTSVLVVDDEPSLLTTARRTLESLCRITTADSVSRGLALARKTRPDVVVIDLRMNGGSGIEMLRTIKAELPNTITVLYSGFLTTATTVAAVRAGADFVLPKPITFRDILAKVATNEEEEEEEVELEETPTLARVERDHIERVLDDCHGNISEAARRLGIYRSSLQRKLRKFTPNR